MFLAHGVLPCAPLHPSVAISIPCMDLYRLAHLRCPSLSIQAFVHTLCDIHAVPFKRYLVRQFSIAYDLYLSILAAVRTRVLHALQRDTADWRLANCCSACTNILDDEAPLRFSLLYTMDGGNSLKRVLRRVPSDDETGETLGPSSEMIDSRTVGGDYYLSREAVDKFIDNEVTIASGAVPAHPEDEERNPCAERWENMAPDITKKMWGIFDETGIFIAVCRHGSLLVLADMVRSGELTKYPLAVTEKLLDTFGKDLGGGYDIGCSFATTLARSSIGARAQELNHTSLVGAFHGHAHNRLCQLRYLAVYTEGLGLEDLEGGERIFSKSNPLARSLRYASVFHRRQAIVTYFEHSDTFETYQNLTTFLLNNYKQALEILASAPTALAKAMQDLGIANIGVFDQWREEEKTYLQNLRTEPMVETLEMEYYKLLVNLRASQLVLDGARAAWVLSTPATQATRTRDYTRSIETKRRHALETRDKDLVAVQELEAKLNIAQRWEPGIVEWEQTGKMVVMRSYQRALDLLEGLVVARMFELTKMNMSQTGYKLRKHIAKALQARSQAIRTALERYNKCAQALEPPRPTIDWQEVVEYAFLADFDLLRNARQDVRPKPWATPAGRLAMDLHYKILRAREEIQRLNVEIPRVATDLRDEELARANDIANASNIDPLLAPQIRRYRMERGRFHEYHLGRLRDIAALPGFSGSIEPRTRRKPEVQREEPEVQREEPEVQREEPEVQREEPEVQYEEPVRMPSEAALDAPHPSLLPGTPPAARRTTPFETHLPSPLEAYTRPSTLSEHLDGDAEDRACDEEQAAEDAEEQIGQDFLEILSMSADV
ncbi:hypothetical protein BV25DRAFT_1872035 [Artomyces pyxidatus]|uniref:Uncharacterized protein n=1 Tax=Artomyces pyxidatus TaxID=48021 RepID=A0ACB8SPE9_9AGAM|nr:hypothetical protein BV25DRAFT_1872035 [Artomyces pyxidatus]